MSIARTAWKINVPTNPEETNYSPDEKYRKEFPSVQEIAERKKQEEAAKKREDQATADLLQGWTKV